MRKKNTLYTVSKDNMPLFADVDRVHQNIFDGIGSSYMGGNYDVGAYKDAHYGQGVDFNTAKQVVGSLQSSSSGTGFNFGSLFGGSGGSGGAGGSGGPSTGGSLVGAIPGIATGIMAGMQDRPQYSADAHNGFSTVDTALTQGKKSKVGTSLVNAGASWMNSALKSGNPKDMFWAGVVGTVGTIINNGWGIGVDEKKLKAVNESIDNYNNFESRASSLDNIVMPTAGVTNTDLYTGGVFTKDEAAEENRRLKKRLSDARAFAYNGVGNNIFNITTDKQDSDLARYAAFGGPIDVINNNDMGAINYGFMSDYLTMKGQNNQNKNQMTSLFAGTPSTMFDLGGVLQTHGSDWGSGLTHINAGGSHESNPNDGIQMGVDSEGTPNLVEEDETVWNDYVFSNRIFADEETKSKFHLPKKKDITYAEISKKLEKEIAERPNDAVSRAGFNAQMQTLEEQQERQKAEMEAARAREAFEALSPEEQTAIMQNAAQQEAMQQPSPEEQAIMQQQMMQADGSQAMIGQQALMMADGGKLYAGGGDMKTKLYEVLKKSTDSDFKKWLEDNDMKDLSERFDNINWDEILTNDRFRAALSKDNPALAHALENEYDFGVFTPDNTGNVTFKDISKGNWTAQDYEGWKESQDPAWLEAAKKGLVKEGMKQEDIAKALKQTDSYKRGSKWLQDSEDNRLRYLRTILEDEYSPEVAKNYARKFIDDNGWKEGAPKDYESIFGANGKGVRETHPGTYWHTPVEAIRDTQVKNWVINNDGKVEEIIGAVPTDWIGAGNYSWATPESDLTYNYYRRPAAATTPEEVKTPEQKIVEEELERKVAPDLRKETSFGMWGPGIGLGLMATGLGKPDNALLDSVVSGAGIAHTADYQPIGNYLTYRPMDIWYQQNALNAQSRATDRALLNSNSPSRAAGLLANGYNSQLASGNLYRQALEYNDALEKQVEDFNRGTDMFNAQAYNQNQQFNANALNNAASDAMRMKLGAAQARLDNDKWWASNLYGNINGLFDNINQWEKWKRDHNTVAKMAADGLFGNMSDQQNIGDGYLKIKTKSKGGKLKKRKKGLTY